MGLFKSIRGNTSAEPRMAAGQKTNHRPADQPGPKVAYFLLRAIEEGAQITGGTWSNIAVLSSLDKHEVLVLTNARDLVGDELARRGIGHVVLPEALSWAGARKDIRTLARKVATAIAFNARVCAACKAEGVQVFQCDENATTFVGIGAKLAGCKLVVVYRNHPNVVPRMRVIYKLPMLIADHLVGASDALFQAILTQGWLAPASRTSRIYNGIDLAQVTRSIAACDRPVERARLGVRDGEIAIGVIGSIVPFKVQAELIADVIAPAAAQFREVGARFHFLGGVKDEAYAARCRAIVDEHKVSDLVAWHGYIEDMTPWLLALDIIAFPASESTARTLIEGAAYGIPAVTRSSCKEVVMDAQSGFLCVEIKDFIEPLLRLARDRELRERLGHGGRRFAAQRFDLRKNSESYSRLYETLVASSSLDHPSLA